MAATRKPSTPPESDASESDQVQEVKTATGLDLLRLPFPPNQISKLPKQVRKDDQDKGRCEANSRYSADGYACGGWHARSMHLDYVGHAAITDRLLDADQQWDWQPAYRDVNPQVLAAACATGSPEIVRMVIENAPPLIDADGGMWIKLTVDGTTRLGYGDAQGKRGPNATKERIGDALRNAGMRFGMALELWHKGDLHGDGTEGDEDAPRAARQEPSPDPQPSGRDWLAEAKTITDEEALLQLGRECNAFGEFVGLVKDGLVARRQELAAATNGNGNGAAHQ